MSNLNENYLIDEWRIVEKKFELDDSLKNESLFTVANGYIGLRGNFEEGIDNKRFSVEGTYINGFYETHKIKYGEKAYAFPEIGQTMLNVFNAKKIKIEVDDEEFNMLHSEILDYKRVLDLKEGTLKRSVVWRTKSDKEIEINFERLASLIEKHLAAIRVTIKPINFDGEIKITSTIDCEVKNITSEDDPRVGSGIEGKALDVYKKNFNNDIIEVYARTKNSKFDLVCAAKNVVENVQFSKKEFEDNNQIGYEYKIKAERNKEIVLTKYIAYATTRDLEYCDLDKIKEEVLEKAYNDGFDKIKNSQIDYLNEFWEKADVEIDGDVNLQQGIRFNMFHILQSTGRDGITNICAKGLTGEGYEGHYFWDTEMYIVPMFTYTMPEVARKLLEYRYNILDKARDRARQMSHKKGALFSWRSINGEECSAYFPASTAQYHINADIAYAIKKYYEATNDIEFMKKYGAEVLFETARIWIDVGHYVDGRGFCIDGVTGPDEYTAIVNNNAYTNIMAKDHLKFAHDMVNILKKEDQQLFMRLKNKIALQDEEVEEWLKASNNMYIPYDDKLKIHPQDDSFLNKKVWDFENTPKDKYPLLLHYHPLVIYRHQVCKQADWVLALFLHSDMFSKEQKKRDYDYYEKVTTHDSSLSPCIFSIVACDIGYNQKAYDYFMKTARMDLEDHHGNTKDGIHAANMAGSWMGMVFGFGGFRVNKDKIKFNPIIPDKWNRYSFRVNYKGRLIKVKVEKHSVLLSLLEGEPIKVDVYNNTVLLTQDRDIEVNTVTI
ncbi:MAG: glycoside hydrolase family 65 protein [Clostridiales bacterium]|nr:glycoside hydrolase family 65 protein [Clostridiales bacterium]